MSPPNHPQSAATPSTSTDRSRTDHLCSRRTFIAAGSTTALVSLAGCSAVADFLADMALQEVNVFNGADESVSGTIEVVDSDDETVLEETFDLEASSEDDESDENTEATAQYDDVWTGTGDYEVTVALDEPLEEGTTDDSSDESGNETNETNESESTADEELANESDGANESEDESTPVEDADGETDGNETDGNETDGNETDGENETDEPSQSGPSKTDTVSIDDTDEQSLVIGIAQDKPDDLISYHVIEDFSDLEDEFE